MLWFFLALIATVAIAFFAIASKYLLKGEKVDAVGYGAVIELLVGGYALFSIFFIGSRFVITPTSLLLTIGVCFLYVGTSAAYYTALKHLEASRLVIIISLEALFTQLTANIILHEPYSVNKVAGAFVIFLAVGLVTFSTKTLGVVITRYDLLALANAGMYSVTALIDSYLVNHYYSPLSYQVINFGFTAILVMLVFPTSRRAIPKMFNWRRKWPLLALTSFLLFLTYFATLNAYNLGGEVSRITPILSTQTLAVVVLEFFILKDRQNLGRKVLASLFAVIGVFLMQK